jgi:hypothetical protein
MDRISDPRDDPSKVPPHDSETNMEPAEKFGTDVARGDLIELDSADAVLAAKMHLLNEVPAPLFCLEWDFPSRLTLA